MLKRKEKNFVFFCLSLLLCFKAAAVKCESLTGQQLAEVTRKVNTQQQELASQQQELASQQQELVTERP